VWCAPLPVRSGSGARRSTGPIYKESRVRLRPLNPAVTGYTHGPSGVEYLVDEHGTITVPLDVAETLLEFANTWVIDHTVTGPDTPAEPAEQTPEPPDPTGATGTETTETEAIGTDASADAEPEASADTAGTAEPEDTGSAETAQPDAPGKAPRTTRKTTAR
jgi:hypothetical protein